jgi:hypothetical protein
VTTTGLEPSDPFMPPASAVHFTAPDGELFIWRPARRIVAQVGVGVFSESFADQLIQLFQPFLEEGLQFLSFVDFSRLTRYTREARELMTAYSRAHLESVGALHMLLSSKIIALALSAYSRAIGDRAVHAYSDRSSFLRAYQRALYAD